MGRIASHLIASTKASRESKFCSGLINPRMITCKTSLTGRVTHILFYSANHYKALSSYASLVVQIGLYDLELPAIQICLLKFVDNMGFHSSLLVLIERVPSNTHHHVMNWSIVNLGKTPINAPY